MSNDTPGTVRLFAETGEYLYDEPQLIPTPSQSPDDPLNWSKGRKALCLSCLLIFTLANAVSATSLYSIYGPLSDVTGLTLDELNIGTGYSYWAIGFGAIFFQPLALAFGKRPVFIFSALANGLINIWTVYLTGNGSWIVSRLVLGFSAGPSFCLVETAIADIRALPMGLYVFFLYVGALLGPMLSGYIYEGSQTWQAPIWWSIGLSCAAAVYAFIMLEETNFSRLEPTIALSVDEPASAVIQDVSHGDIVNDAETTDKKQTDAAHHTRPVDATIQRIPSSKWQGPRSWRFLTISPHAGGIMWRGLVQPFALMRLPIVLWCGFMYGIYQVYFNFVGALTSGVLSADPYNFSSGSIGLTFLGPLIGCVIGAIAGGWIVDRHALRQARKHGGVSEPEYKLKLFLIPGVLLPIAQLMVGLGPYYGAHWSVFVLGELLSNLGGPLATLLVIVYAFDSFHSIDPDDASGVRASAQDAAPYMMALIFLGMCVTFAFGYAITPWSFGWDFRYFGITAALSAVAVNGSVVLVIIYGKRLRRRGEAYYRKVINW